jgi:hypothetical protein
LIKININVVFWDVTPRTLVDTSFFEMNAFSVFRLPVAYLHNYSITCQTQAVLIEEEVFFRNETRQLKLMVFLNK